MGKRLGDYVESAFIVKFKESLPEEIDPKEVKGLRTILNRLALKNIGHQFPKKRLREEIKYYIDRNGYTKMFELDYQRRNVPQWNYRRSTIS